MKEKILYCIWGGLYVLCAGLSFLTGAQGFGKALLVIFALLFFLPGGILLYEGIRSKNRRQILRIRRICLLSLGLTLLALVGNFLSVLASEAVGEALYDILVLVSVPMVCGQYWFLSLFLWACLLFCSFHKAARKEKT